jgi:hypothetical protein
LEAKEPTGYYSPDGAAGMEEQQLIERWGPKYRAYYQLEHTFFQSALDTQLTRLLSERYSWYNDLASSPLLVNKATLDSRIQKLANKVESAESAVASSGGSGGGSRYGGHSAVAFGMGGVGGGSGGADSGKEKPLAKLVEDSNGITTEIQKGTAGQVIKDALFNLQPKRN